MKNGEGKESKVELLVESSRRLCLCLCKLLDVIIDNIILLCFIVFVVSRLLLVNCLSGVMFWGDREGLSSDWVVLFEFEWIGILFLLEFFLFFVLFMFLEEEL